MGTISKKLVTVSGGLIAVILVVFFLLGTNAHIGFIKENVQPFPQKVITQQQNTFGYNGEQGKNALTLLKAHASVEFASSGMVNSINGRKASDSKHEYWAFYVNGKMAQVGAADYITKTGDRIEWKIETY